MTTSRGKRVVDHLNTHPQGATWRELASMLGITWAHHVLDGGYQEVRTAVQHARLLAEQAGKVIPRPTPDSDYRYRLENKVGTDPRGLDGTLGGWILGREDVITRVGTLVRQADVLLRSGTLTPLEQRRLRRQQTKDRGDLVALEDDLASFQRTFRHRNGAVM